jgi:hypothetical protein
LSEGVIVSIWLNNIDLTPGSRDMLDIEALQVRGIEVRLNPPD